VRREATFDSLKYADLTLYCCCWRFSLLLCSQCALEREKSQVMVWRAVLAGGQQLSSRGCDQPARDAAVTDFPSPIDKELGWAGNMQTNTTRVYLHDLVWQEELAGFKQRIDHILQIRSRHHVPPLCVILDSGCDPNPKLGMQPPLVRGVHNSRWAQSSGTAALQDL
jgi:hypothetical protein